MKKELVETVVTPFRKENVIPSSDVLGDCFWSKEHYSDREVERICADGLHFHRCPKCGGLYAEVVIPMNFIGIGPAVVHCLQCGHSSRAIMTQRPLFGETKFATPKTEASIGRAVHAALVDFEGQKYIPPQYEEYEEETERTSGYKFFEHREFGRIRTIVENGTVFFCGKDVALALGYKDTTNALKLHCKNDGVVFRHLIDKLGRNQEAKFITEGNVYRLIIHSKLPSAERFERWVFEEVLPSIRSTGGYGSNQEIMNDEELLAKALIVAQRQLEETKKQLIAL